ncbi:helix-turn-helix domain-containing protein [Altererythrobacter arenosus]|uniref:Helix-turn-helix domain-containing protein n=1 Tax=Altererythrobacter arenosus TaxID=3032592 RepID=A0ABY8FUX4_9SPHN|nr:helix-turn-helix domain-containing protein [Altererythrobacter sp. CAU 1644]WFL78807.1 helix-turn-helix domain-containing protein [Altererythrobacter sp. CAU 1644]
MSDYLQPEWSNLRFFCGALPMSRIPGREILAATDFTATGPSSLPVQFELGSCRMWGIGLLPLGWSRLFGVQASSLANVICDGRKHPAFAKFAELAEVLCEDSCSPEEQCDAIVETMRKLMKPSRDEDKIVTVHRVLVEDKPINVKEFAELAGLSIRSLERLCHRYFGFPPKLLMRRQRFVRTLATFMLHPGGKWTEAMDEEYHDQAQFSREFREFMTMNPSEYAALEHPVLAAFMEERARVWGSPAQALDRPG